MSFQRNFVPLAWGHRRWKSPKQAIVVSPIKMLNLMRSVYRNEKIYCIIYAYY